MTMLRTAQLPTSAAPMPTFDEFYRAINEREPFPWQARLAREVAKCGTWRRQVGVPTGLGKTACLDIAVWWLASQADLPPAQRTAPTRIWWVVNRRLLVDSTHSHAVALSTKLESPEAQGLTGEDAIVVSGVADRLRTLAAGSGRLPLEVIRLRGGVSTGRPSDPSAPAVVLSTLPMFGSRLLFRGYGSSRGLRPVDAALAGTDSLVLLDEAHLAPHLMYLVPALVECAPANSGVLPDQRSKPLVVALTATGDSSDEDRFDLDCDDEIHSVVRQRLDAAKPVRVVEGSGDGGRALAKSTMDLLRDAHPATCLVFANTPATARSAFDRLRKGTRNVAAEVLLLTGRSREREAELVRARVLDSVEGMPAGRDASIVRPCSLIVVATQTLEVGADVDAEYLVTECCGVRALTQRLGRLNRLGNHRHARATYVHLPAGGKPRKGGEWPVYGAEPAGVLARLKASGAGQSQDVNLSPRKVAAVLGPPNDDPGRAPEVLHGLLWEWLKTTTPPDGEAPVEPYFAGIEGPAYAVSLIWRVHVPEDGEALWPRPSDREAVDVPIAEVRQVFGDEEALLRLDADRVTVESVTRNALRPGDTVVLGTDRGLLDEFGWAPRSEAPVVDVSVASHGLPLSKEGLRRLCGVTISQSVIDRAVGISGEDEDLDDDEKAMAAEEVVSAVSESAPCGWVQAEWSEFLSRLGGAPVVGRKEVPRLALAAGRGDSSSDSRDERSLSPTSTRLDPHCVAVGVRSRSIAERIGVSSELAQVVEWAGRLHDAGKADVRFQRWLDPQRESSVPVAKSDIPRHRWDAARVAAAWPRGGRHEALSARLVVEWLTGAPGRLAESMHDLLVHLVISHHGSGRPLVRPVSDSDGSGLCVSAEVQGVPVKVPADLEIVDWEQPGRFRRLNDHFGPWGLALLEAIVRQADHEVSAGAEIVLPEGYAWPK